MNDATILVERDGRYVDASPSALEILGVTLDELRALAPGSLAGDDEDDAERAARAAAFEESGASRAIGAATIRRPDGRPLRVRFLIDEQPDGRYLAHLRPADEDTGQPTVLFTIGQVLAEWRAAERRLQTLPEGSAEWAAAQAEIASFRVQYRRLSERPARNTN